MRRLVALAMRSNIGLILIGLLITALAFSILNDQCICADEGECFCISQPERLHNVTDAELRALPEPNRQRYQLFLGAWEEEYQSRLLLFGRLYADFHASSHTAEEERNFDQQLVMAHRDFLRVFEYRHALFRERQEIE